MGPLEFLDLHPFVRGAAADKARGVILGGALGDALGLYTEFLPATEAQRSYPDGINLGQTAFRGDSHRDKFLPGSWTDDTDHSLLLVLSYLHHYGSHRAPPSPSVLSNDLAARLASWCQQGLLALSKPPLGLGRTIATVALNPAYLNDPHALAREKWNDVKLGEKPASNGSLMRTHPVGVMAVACASTDEAYALAAEVSTASHADPRCTLACCAAVGVLRGLIRGDILEEEDLEKELERAKKWIERQPELLQPGDRDPNNENMLRWLKLDEFDAHTSRDATLESLELDDSQKMGYIYKCLGSGIVTLRRAMRDGAVRSDTFAKLMTALVMKGGDADTNGSVAGALLGAWVGAARLPQVWMEQMTDHAWLETKNRRFVAAIGIRDAEGDQEWKEKEIDEDADINGGKQPLTMEERNAMERSMVFAVLSKSKQREDAARQREKQNQGKKWFGLRSPH